MAKFQKGHSGNPGGRPKKDPTLIDAAKAKTMAALNTLAEIMMNPDESGSARVSAACAILDRGHGKPVQMTELTGADGGPIQTEDVSQTDMARRIAFILTSGVEEKTH